MANAASRARYILIGISCFLCTVGVALIIAALFSASFRTIEIPILNGRKYFGLFRYCWEPFYGLGNSMPSVSQGIQSQCYLRSLTNPMDTMSGYRVGTGMPNSNENMWEFEKTTLVLLVCAMILAIMGLCFALCTVLSVICVLAHATVILGATICAAGGFGVYTYNNEQPDLLGENDKGNMLLYHYGWAYYYTGLASLLFFISFMVSVFASAVFIVHARQSRGAPSMKRTTIKL